MFVIFFLCGVCVDLFALRRSTTTILTTGTYKMTVETTGRLTGV